MEEFNMSKYNKTVALILCIFLGYFGVHHFYVNNTKKGLLYLCTIGLCGFGWIIDIILLCSDKFKDGDGFYVTYQKEQLNLISDFENSSDTNNVKPTISNKARNGIIIGVAAVCGISVCSSLANSNDTETAENTETTTLIIETTTEINNENYIDVNAELDNITKDSEVTDIEETTNNISEITDEYKELSTSTTEEITENKLADELSETHATTSTYLELSNDNNSEAHFTDYDIPEQQNTFEYVLNTSTHKFHSPSCSSVKKIKPENYSTTDSRENAINSGYEPCGKCNP